MKNACSEQEQAFCYLCHKNDEKLADLVIICNEIKPKC